MLLQEAASLHVPFGVQDCPTRSSRTTSSNVRRCHSRLCVCTTQAPMWFVHRYLYSVSPATCPTLFSRTKALSGSNELTLRPCQQVRMCPSWRNGFQVAASHRNVVRRRHLPDRIVQTERARVYSRQGESCNVNCNPFVRSFVL